MSIKGKTSKGHRAKPKFGGIKKMASGGPLENFYGTSSMAELSNRLSRFDPKTTYNPQQVFFMTLADRAFGGPNPTNWVSRALRTPSGAAPGAVAQGGASPLGASSAANAASSAVAKKRKRPMGSGMKSGGVVKSTKAPGMRGCGCAKRGTAGGRSV